MAIQVDQDFALRWVNKNVRILDRQLFGRRLMFASD
jgi:hypothetical protein